MPSSITRNLPDPRACRVPIAEFDHLTLGECAQRDRLREKLARDGALPFHEAFLLGDFNRRSHPPIYDDPPKGAA